MKLKTAALACLATLACGIPAFAKQPSFPDPNHLVMVAKVCDNGTKNPGYVKHGGFYRVITKNQVHAVTFGMADPSETDLGFNVYPTGMPAKNFQLDWDLSQAVDPYFCFIITTSTGTRYWVCYSSPEPGGSGRINTGLSSAFTQTLMPNGFTRINYDGAADGIPAGSKWNLIAVLDYFITNSGRDTVENMTVNGIPVIPDLHAPNRPPIFDCSD